MRAKIEVETLLVIILALVAVWLVLEVINQTLGLLGTLFGLIPFSSLIGVIILALIVLWLLDYV